MTRQCARLSGLVISFLWIALPAALTAQISPGALSRAHQTLSGPTQCIACHRLAARAGENLKCLGCHTEIAERLAAHRGYHAAVVNMAAGDRDCARCHSEHNGENFQLIHWDVPLKQFDHSKTGYVLEGKHAGLACQQCHTAAHVSPAERGKIKVKDLNRTYLGLSRDCLSCHKDQHRGQLGTDCTRCHTFNDWKTVSKFNHAQTRYPLLGEHARVACQKCHKPEPDHPDVTKYKGLAFNACNDCHQDPHKGAFKAACDSCHNVNGWKQVSTATASAKFDHSTTKYPLRGKHADVKCDACHLGGDLTKPIAFQRCLDCHKNDPHKGQFNARKDGGECAACHTVDGFKPATFSVRQHADTDYPLQGMHASVPCAKCHLPRGLDTQYKIKFAACTDCHADIHKGQFAGAPYRNRCEDCHTVHGFKPSTFPLEKHSSTRFPLTGAHLAVPCVDCHKADVIHPGAPIPFHFASLACTTCHVDPHRGEFAARMAALRPDGSPVGCEACHSTASWNRELRFDHATTDFPLTGAHRAVPCINCHKPPNLEVTLKNVVFKAAPKTCDGCHEDPHARQFAKNGQNPPCTSCHNTARWRPSLFDHETRTDFSLKGAHQEVPCRDCHKVYRDVEGKSVLFYKPTPRKCADCHGSKVMEPTQKKL